MGRYTGVTFALHCMDAPPRAFAPYARAHQELDDCFGQVLVRVVCECGAVRHIEPEALARLVGWSTSLKELALADAVLEVRDEGRRGGCTFYSSNSWPWVPALTLPLGSRALPKPRGIPKECALAGRGFAVSVPLAHASPRTRRE